MPFWTLFVDPGCGSVGGNEKVERVVGYDTPMFPIPYKRYKIEYNDGSEKTIGYKVLGLIFITDEIWVQ